MNESRKYRIVVCRGPECGDRRGSEAIHAAFQRVLAERGLAERVELGWQSCFGRCSQGPNVLVRLAPLEHQRFTVAIMPPGAGSNAALYNGIRVADVARLVEEHVVGGRIIRDLVLRPGQPGKSE